MEQADQGTFSCDGCSKSYKWKSQLAGKRVKCKCGHVISVSAEPPVADEPDLDAMYDLAEAEQRPSHSATENVGLRCPSCQGDLPIGEIACPACGFNLRTGKKSSPRSSGGGGAAAVATAGGPASPMLGYASQRKPDPNLDAFAGNQITELWAPIGLIAFGFFGSVLEYTHFSKYTISVGQALPVVGISVIVNMVMIAIGCLAAIKIMDVAFGSPGAAALKVTAIAIAPGALANIVSFMFHNSLGFWVGLVMSMVMYYALFHYLFDFDAGEIMLLATIISIIRMWLGGIVLAVIITAIMPGVGGFGGFGGGGSAPKLNVDVAAEEALDRSATIDARPWLEDNTNRLFGRIPHDASVKILNDLEGMGCKKFFIEKSGPRAGTLIATLPSDSARVKKIKDWAAGKEKEFLDLGFSAEIGNSYIVINF